MAIKNTLQLTRCKKSNLLIHQCNCKGCVKIRAYGDNVQRNAFHSVMAKHVEILERMEKFYVGGYRQSQKAAHEHFIKTIAAVTTILETT